MSFINIDNSAKLTLLVQKGKLLTAIAYQETFQAWAMKTNRISLHLRSTLKHFSGCIQINQLLFIHHNNNALLFC